MDELRVAVCEDNPEEFEKLVLMIQDSGYAVRISAFEDGETFLASYHPGLYDLILMDIYMKGISGVEVVQRIRETDHEILTAFITNSRDHALEGYRLEVARYMEKPVADRAVREVLKLAYEKRQNSPGIRVSRNGRGILVPFSQILYVEQKAHQLLYHLTDGRTIQSRGKLSETEGCFPSPPYLRCHKSYLVNLAYVTGLDRELMVYRMKDNACVHIRRESLKKAKDAWESWLFQTSRQEGAARE